MIGNKQHTYDGHNKSDGTLSTPVSMNGVMIKSAIDVHEGRGMVILHISGAFLWAGNEKFILMYLRRNWKK